MSRRGQPGCQCVVFAVVQAGTQSIQEMAHVREDSIPGIDPP